MLFGVIPFALMMLITVFTMPEKSFITSEFSLRAIILVLLYWALFAVIWAVFTIVLNRIGSFLRKLILGK